LSEGGGRRNPGFRECKDIYFVGLGKFMESGVVHGVQKGLNVEGANVEGRSGSRV